MRNAAASVRGATIAAGFAVARDLSGDGRCAADTGGSGDRPRLPEKLR